MPIVTSPAGTDTVALPGHPQLSPALRRLQRSADTVQLGIGREHARTLRGLDLARMQCLDLLDGSRDLATVRADAAGLGLDAVAVDDLLGTLVRAGVVDDAGTTVPAVPPALEPDRLCMSLRHGRAGADDVLRRRREATVTVYGAGRVGAGVASSLAAAGIGRLACVDRTPLSAVQRSPFAAGLALGVPAGDVLAGHLRGVLPTQTTSAEPSDAAALAVIAPTTAMPAPETVAAASTTPHLLVVLRETSALVGPFVVPGTTPCLRCLELGRADRDPGWPLVAAQLANRPAGCEPSDVVLAALGAAVAALESLIWLDEGRIPETAGTVLELGLDDRAVRRRPVPAHPACGCGAFG